MRRFFMPSILTVAVYDGHFSPCTSLQSLDITNHLSTQLQLILLAGVDASSQ